MAKKQKFIIDDTLINTTSTYQSAITVVNDIYIVKDITLDAIGGVLTYTFVEEIPISLYETVDLSSYSGQFVQLSLGVENKVFLLTDTSRAGIVVSGDSYASRLYNVHRVLSAEMVDVTGFNIKINDEWKMADDSYIKVNGNWKEIEQTYIKVNGNWKEAE